LYYILVTNYTEKRELIREKYQLSNVDSDICNILLVVSSVFKLTYWNVNLYCQV